MLKIFSNLRHTERSISKNLIFIKEMKTHQLKNYSNNIHCTLGWPRYSLEFFNYCLEEKPEGTM